MRHLHLIKAFSEAVADGSSLWRTGLLPVYRLPSYFKVAAELRRSFPGAGILLMSIPLPLPLK